MGTFKNTFKNHELKDVKQKVNVLEEKVFKTARTTTTTKAQQLLILKHLGILEKITDLNISTKKQAKLLSILLNASPDNIEKDLSQINFNNSSLKSKSNYKFLVDAFNQTGLKELAKEADLILDEIQKNSDK